MDRKEHEELINKIISENKEYLDYSRDFYNKNSFLKSQYSKNFDRMGDPIDDSLWALLFKIPEYQILKHDLIDGYLVSTAWLGLDHAFLRTKKPLIFETMIFPKEGENDLDYQKRYSTEEEAWKGHEEAIKWLQNRLNGE